MSTQCLYKEYTRSRSTMKNNLLFLETKELCQEYLLKHIRSSDFTFFNAGRPQRRAVRVCHWCGEQMWDRMGGWYRKWVGNDGAVFCQLQPRFVTTHWSCLLPVEAVAVPLCPAFGGKHRWCLRPSLLPALDGSWCPTKPSLSFLPHSWCGISLCRCHLQIQLLSSQGGNGDLQK